LRVKRFNTYNFRRNSLLRLLFFKRLQKQERNKKTRKVKSNQMTIKLNLLNNADFKNLIKIVDKLEQRIATLEKVLASHSKCIGEMRGEENELESSYN